MNNFHKIGEWDQCEPRTGLAGDHSLARKQRLCGLPDVPVRRQRGGRAHRTPPPAVPAVSCCHGPFIVFFMSWHVVPLPKGLGRLRFASVADQSFLKKRNPQVDQSFLQVLILFWSVILIGNLQCFSVDDRVMLIRSACLGKVAQAGLILGFFLWAIWKANCCSLEGNESGNFPGF